MVIKYTSPPEWGSPEFYIQELKTLSEYQNSPKGEGICMGAAVMIERLILKQKRKERLLG